MASLFFCSFYTGHGVECRLGLGERANVLDFKLIVRYGSNLENFWSIAGYSGPFDRSNIGCYTGISDTAGCSYHSI